MLEKAPCRRESARLQTKPRRGKNKEKAKTKQRQNMRQDGEHLEAVSHINDSRQVSAGRFLFRDIGGSQLFLFEKPKLIEISRVL
ncbi:MAG: hypothetical protein ACLTK0_02590 [Anaerovoracaceae bacterium]